MKHHPDRNPGDSEANRTHAADNIACRLLPCGMLLEDEYAKSAGLRRGKYNLSSRWGYFLWW